MIGLVLLKRFWPYLAAAALIVGFYFWAYGRGADAVQARWDAADRIAADALLVANTKTALVTDRAEHISTDVGESFDDDLARADSLHRDLDGLSLCRTPGGGGEPVPAVPTSEPVAHGQGTLERGGGGAQSFGSALAEVLTACRKVIAADRRHIEFHERQHENRTAH